MLKRIYAIFVGRNKEFIRDRSSLAWSLLLPIVLVFALAFAFDGDRDEYKVGVIQDADTIDETQHAYLSSRYIQFVPYSDQADALRKVSRHQLDLVVEFSPTVRYWVNPTSPKGHFAELSLLHNLQPTSALAVREDIGGEAVNYSDWVLPGILGMNMMFSSLFGVGYVVVRYRKNGFLKRLRATPLSALEFIIAQVASRLMLILLITTAIYVGTHWILDTRMEGSYLTLLLIAIVGATSLTSLGLVVSARVTSEELAGGLLNMINWPMMMLSGVWFSLEGAGETLQRIANIFPLTHILNAARAVMLDGATLADIAPSMIALSLLSVAFLALGARLFRWAPH